MVPNCMNHMTGSQSPSHLISCLVRTLDLGFLGPKTITYLIQGLMSDEVIIIWRSCGLLRFCISVHGLIQARSYMDLLAHTTDHINIFTLFSFSIVVFNQPRGESVFLFLAFFQVKFFFFYKFFKQLYLQKVEKKSCTKLIFDQGRLS